MKIGMSTNDFQGKISAYRWVKGADFENAVKIITIAGSFCTYRQVVQCGAGSAHRELAENHEGDLLMNRFLICLVTALGLAGLPSASSAQGFPSPELLAEDGYEGRIRLVRFLDEPDGYCLDIPGAPGNPIPGRDVWAHTCHMFTQIDQVFSVNADGENRIVWNSSPTGNPQCLTAQSQEAGAGFSAEDCDEAKIQSFEYTEEGQFRVSGTEQCIHVQSFGTTPRQQVAEGQDRYGRGLPVNPPMSHLARPLVLAPCDSGDDGFSRWMAIE